MKDKITQHKQPTAIDRIRLHLQCPWRNPHEARFHIAGILREFGIPAVE